MTTSIRSNFRWVICGLLFFAAAINYIDRQVIGILKKTLQEEFVFDERAYAAIVFSFQAAYAIGLLLAGRIMDRIGVRVGFSLAVVPIVLCRPNDEPLGCSRTCFNRSRRSSRLVGKPIYFNVGYVSKAGCRFRCGYWRNGGCHWRHVYRIDRRRDPPENG